MPCAQEFGYLVKKKTQTVLRLFLFLPSLNIALHILAQSLGSFVMYCNISSQLSHSKT